MNSKIVSVIGPTASGKSGLGILLAREFNGEIISCDSRQVYKGLDIGSAKVTREEQALVRHHLLDVADPKTERFNVCDFQRLAYEAIDDILARGKVPFLVGGSGMYSRSIVEGYVFDTLNTESEARDEYEGMALEDLQDLAQERGLVLNNSDFNNKRRLIGKLSVGAGRCGNAPRYNVLQICLAPEKDTLTKNVAARIEARLGEGVIEETEELLKSGVDADFLQSLGMDYFWSVEVALGHVSIDEYKKNLTLKHMQFIKRQMTWFKKEKNTVFLDTPAKYVDYSKKLIKRFLAE
jgi:tRNA dimethylallyltransferase